MLVKKINSIIGRVTSEKFAYINCLLNILQNYNNIELHELSNVGLNKKNEICILLIHKNDIYTTLEIIIGNPLTVIINGMIENLDDKFCHQKKCNDRIIFFELYLMSILKGNYSKTEFWLLNLFKLGIQLDYEQELGLKNKIFIRYNILLKIIKYCSPFIIKKRFKYVQFIKKIQ